MWVCHEEREVWVSVMMRPDSMTCSENRENSRFKITLSSHSRN